MSPIAKSLLDASAYLGITSSELVQIIIATLTSSIGLWAALAAWRAAKASEKSALEMQIARHQYVRPMLVFSSPEPMQYNAAIELGLRQGIMKRREHRKIGIKNVGKGPAFDISVRWLSKIALNINLDEFRVDAINDILGELGFFVDVKADGDWTYIFLRAKSEPDSSVERFYHGSYIQHTFYDKIEEGETVYCDIPDSSFVAKFFLDLNDMVKSSSRYGYFLISPGDFEDDITISLRSITDDPIAYNKTFHYTGGVWSPTLHENEGKSIWKMPAIIGGRVNDPFPSQRKQRK